MCRNGWHIARQITARVEGGKLENTEKIPRSITSNPYDNGSGIQTWAAQV